MVATNFTTRQNALDDWCHSVVCCDRDFFMCPRQWVLLHCQILPSSYWRLLKFRDEEIKQDDLKYLYTNKHHPAFRRDFEPLCLARSSCCLFCSENIWILTCMGLNPYFLTCPHPDMSDTCRCGQHFSGLRDGAWGDRGFSR